MSRRLPRSLIKQIPTIKNLGIDILRDPRTNKGTAFTLKERQILGIHGLLPSAVLTQEEQVKRTISNLYALDDDLSRYNNLMALHDRNESLFFKTITSHLEYCLPIIYTPTVGTVCENYGMMLRRPRGIYISIHDRGHVLSILRNWPEKRIKAIVMTDGGNVLSLGDLGSNAMGVPVGKVSLYTALAGIKPHYCLPITLDVGTNNPELLKSDFYSGLVQSRVTGDDYDSFLDEVMEAISICYGPNACIHFEDFANDNAVRILERYQNQYISFNGDIQASGATVLAGILASSRATQIQFPDNKFLIYGSGQSSLGIAHFLTQALIREYGLSEEAALSKIYMMDTQGLLIKNRPKKPVDGPQAKYARKDLGPINLLNEAVRVIKPSVLIGASGSPDAFDREILREMGAINKHPVIFALSNPTQLAECTAEMAYRSTECRCIFVSGSPFAPVRTPDGQIFVPSQGNSCYIFPGLALALTCTGIRPVGDQVFIRAAKTLAASVTDEQISKGSVYPSFSDIRKVSLQIAIDLAEDAFRSGTASYHPEPKDKAAFIQRKMYHFGYLDFTPEVYPFPEG